MPDAGWLSGALLLGGAWFGSAAGLAWLALTLEPHWRQVRGEQPLPAAAIPRMRALGSALLCLSLLLCFRADHPSMAVLVWIMTLATAAPTVAFTFTWKPRVFSPLLVWVGR